MAINRREFIGGGIAALGTGAFRAAMAAHPLAGTVLPRWEQGHFRITMLYTGSSEASFLVFPDGTSMLIDCGDYGCYGVPLMPDGSRRAGEWTARYVLRENPNGAKVDYFMLSHYHSDHSGNGTYSAGRSANGTHALSGIGQAIESLEFATIIDRSYPDVNDPAPRPDTFDEGTVKHVKEVYAEAVRRGATVEKFRLEKNSTQISLRHGGSPLFSFTPLCANGKVLRRDGTVLDLGTVGGEGCTQRSAFSENALSIGLVFGHGDFRYYTAGDFEGYVTCADGSKINIEDELAKECPRVDVAKADHHGCYQAMPDSLIAALHARLVVAGMWHTAHMGPEAMERFGKATWPCLYAPGYFPDDRRQAGAGRPWMNDMAAESFEGAHAVIDVAPDGKTYRLMMVTAGDESGTILGAYDFTTSTKDDASGGASVTFVPFVRTGVSPANKPYVNAGVVARSGTKVEARFSGCAGSDKILLGAARNGMYVTWMSRTGGGKRKMYAGYANAGGGRWWGDGVTEMSEGAYHEMTCEITRGGTVRGSFDGGETTVWRGKTSGRAAADLGDFDTGLDMFIFGLNYNGRLWDGWSGETALYGLKIWQTGDDGAYRLVRSFRPCVDGDGVAALYDEVSGAPFYPSNGRLYAG